MISNRVTRYLPSVFVLLIHLLNPSSLFAQSKGFTFQAYIQDPSNRAVTASGLTVKARILAPNGCILREESFVGINIADGYLNLPITKGTVTGSDPGLSINSVFKNTDVVNNLVCLNLDNTVNAQITSYSPSASDARKLRISFAVGADNVVADFNMRSVPFAQNSDALNGKIDTDFINTSSAITQVAAETWFVSSVMGQLLAGTYNAPSATSAVSVSGTVGLAHGGTGATSVAGARTNLGLGSLATMTPTGTADGTTYLRGDGTWAAVSAVGSESDPTVQAFAKNTVSTGLSVNGSNQLQVNVGTTANKILQLDGAGKIPVVDGSQLTNLPSPASFTGDLAGDVTGPQGETVVSRLNGVSVSTAVAGDDGKFLKYVNGSGWSPQYVTLSELRNATGVSSAFNVTGCSSAQTMTWSSITDQFSCQDISIPSTKVTGLAASATTDTTNASNISSGTLSADRLPSSVTNGLWTESGGSVYRNSGNVGIGTTNPQSVLDVNGNVRVGDQGVTCGSSNQGSIRLNSLTHVLEFCDGNLWISAGNGTSIPASISLAMASCPAGWTAAGSLKFGPNSASAMCQAPAADSLIPANSTVIMESCPSGWTRLKSAANGGNPFFRNYSYYSHCQSPAINSPLPKGSRLVVQTSCPSNWNFVPGSIKAAGMGAMCNLGTCAVCEVPGQVYPSSIEAGSGGTTSNGGYASVIGGTGGSTSGTGGMVHIFGGSAVDGNGGAVQISAGHGNSVTSTTRSGGIVSIWAGQGVYNGDGGAITVTGGRGDGTGIGGTVTISGGPDGAGGTYKPVILQNLGGNVGIGTPNPSSRLTVNGDIETTSGGVRFSDGSLQETAAASVFTGVKAFSNPASINYFALSSPAASADTVEGNIAIPMPTGTFSKFYLRQIEDQGSVGACIVTVRVSGADTPLSITIPANSPSGSTFINTSQVASVQNEGSLVSIKVDNSAETSSSCRFNYSLSFYPAPTPPPP